MSKHVYLAGPIAGCTYAEATDWRGYVMSGFDLGIAGISPMRMKEWCQRMGKIGEVAQYKAITTAEEFLISGESHAIRARDFHDVRVCDLMFAYLPKELNERRPSWGTSMEMGWASAQQKPIVLVTDDDSLSDHPLVRESVGWIVPTLKLGVAVVNSVFHSYI